MCGEWCFRIYPTLNTNDLQFSEIIINRSATPIFSIIFTDLNQSNVTFSMGHFSKWTKTIHNTPLISRYVRFKINNKNNF